MNIVSFIEDKMAALLVNILSMVALSIFLIVTGSYVHEVILILIFWWVIFFGYTIAQFYSKDRYFNNLLEVIKQLKEKYLIAEIMERPHSWESIQFYNLLKMSNKAMLEKITEIKNERKEYKEYIERWVHEVKTPIASVKLICENNKNETIRRVLSELESIDNYVEQVLFYARSENVEKDYLIKEVRLTECINSAVVRNKQLLIKAGMKIQAEQSELTAYTDIKWIEFILNQLIVNAVKYRKDEDGFIEIKVLEEEKGVSVNVKDNGLGIYSSEISRVFEKGFTGTNGRKNDKSTGIGLFLCKRLCKKLNIDISIDSKVKEYTIVKLFFPKGTFVKM